LLSVYEFPGDEIPVVKGCAKQVLDGDPAQVAAQKEKS